MPRRTSALWHGQEPYIYPEVMDGTHGAFMTGLWHQRMVAAWRKAWDSCLIESVQSHGDGLYTVPSQTQEDKWYAVRRYPLAPDGYLFICDCAASERGGVVCAHSMAAYLFRLRHTMHWRLKKPDDDQRAERTAAETA
jgi:hypothetical protein